MEVSIRYQNHTAQPQIILPIAHWNDPNNLSVRASRNRALADELLDQAGAMAPASEAVEVLPGFAIEWTAQISLSERLFYCLFEFNLFIDFEWNWFSATLRQPNIFRWLNSEEYRRSLDPKSIFKNGPSNARPSQEA
jgi:hypothetical protein